jgi:hypothetical protein
LDEDDRCGDGCVGYRRTPGCGGIGSWAGSCGAEDCSTCRGDGVMHDDCPAPNTRHCGGCIRFTIDFELATVDGECGGVCPHRTETATDADACAEWEAAR